MQINMRCQFCHGVNNTRLPVQANGPCGSVSHKCQFVTYKQHTVAVAIKPRMHVMICSTTAVTVKPCIHVMTRSQLATCETLQSANILGTVNGIAYGDVYL